MLTPAIPFQAAVTRRRTLACREEI
ncbi:hypothetical protein MAR_026953 [Mya arenaria]|uniref:Uncharacterized protein n=1 Tax=Mya arenaria TaxID=6604 RepID=A0ABY7EW67_MYAAR|nr:hypothetical protein MAR_026953 [Mya arenaria]